MIELYENQIYMTVDQAEDLVRILNQTLEAVKTRKQQGPGRGPQVI